MFVGLAVCGPAWLIFGSEPRAAADGALNPLVLIVPSLLVGFGVALVPPAIGLVRRPLLAADHYAVTVRPGILRTLVLAWAQLAELAVVEVDSEVFLLLRCNALPVRSADLPRWWDQAYLRSVRRDLATASAYDLAVPIGDFVGEPGDLVAELASLAPAHVAVFDRRTDPPA